MFDWRGECIQCYTGKWGGSGVVVIKGREKKKWWASSSTGDRHNLRKLGKQIREKGFGILAILVRRLPE